MASILWGPGYFWLPSPQLQSHITMSDSLPEFWRAISGLVCKTGTLPTELSPQPWLCADIKRFSVEVTKSHLSMIISGFLLLKALTNSRNVAMVNALDVRKYGPFSILMAWFCLYNQYPHLACIVLVNTQNTTAVKPWYLSPDSSQRPRTAGNKHKVVCQVWKPCRIPGS